MATILQNFTNFSFISHFFLPKIKSLREEKENHKLNLIMFQIPLQCARSQSEK